ncbi:MAG: hypothetical protein A2X48_04775 [Lentisphaerae bacterium GWF2_49_21]|nr:MAG: hypothetical protein A2X48_04775 [Lentisphaerae bacterium GWF2_49_21]
MNMKKAGQIKIRKMIISDYSGVFVLWKNMPGIGLDKDCDSKKGIKDYLKRNPGLSFVACDGKKIVGTVLSGHDGRRGYLHHLAMVASYRKLGIGKELVECCLKGLARQNIPKCNIFLFKSNASGRSFWKHNGWNLRQDLSIMQKETRR